MPLPSVHSTPAPQGEISTFGWDTAFAVRIANVNQAIVAKGVSPTVFDYTDPSDGQEYCKGEFEPWVVVRGGDGGGVNIKLPVKNVVGQTKAAAGYTPYSWSGGSLTFTVRLEFFNVGERKHHLKVKPTSDEASVPVVELYGSDVSVPVAPAWAVYALQAALTAWCKANLAAFAYVFSVVDLNDEADRGAWSFLKPTAVSYSYVDGDTDEDAFLGVLAMTHGEDPGGLQQVLDKRIVQANEQGAFCISRSLLLKKLVTPNLIKLWSNLGESQLSYGENDIQLKANESVELPQVEEQGQYYTPQLKEFSLTIEGEEITLDAYTETDVQDGVTAWCRTTARYTITKGTNKQGQTTLAYSQLGDPQTSHGHRIAEWVKITDAILAVVVAVALAALAVVTGGAAVPVIAVLGALLVGVIGLAPEISGMIENDDAPAIDLLQENVYAPIVWTDSKDFSVLSVELDGSLRLGGALGFGT